MAGLEERVLELVEELTRAGLTKKCQAAGLVPMGKKDKMARQLAEWEQSVARGSSTGTFLDVEEDVNACNPPKLEAINGCVSGPPEMKTAMYKEPYSFKDVEEAIESFGAEGVIEYDAWLSDFEVVAAMARWTDEQKYVMCRKK